MIRNVIYFPIRKKTRILPVCELGERSCATIAILLTLISVSPKRNIDFPNLQRHLY